MAVSKICRMILVLHSKKLFFNINSAISANSVDEFLHLSFLLISHIKLVDHHREGILGYKPTTSAITNMTLDDI